MQPSGSQRSKKNTMRPPASRAPSAVHSTHGRVSPAESVKSSSKSRVSPQPAGVKRKTRDYELSTGEETNINVVVRCRCRTKQECDDNTGTVVRTDGVNGSSVDLSTSAMTNKTYHFDKTFSAAADQGMVFKEVAGPILNDVVSGFNCTIFAYGQTGTGKTYTMSGDITDVLPIPDEAGIIPRILHSLFDKLGTEDSENSLVKCSFIELYNEELKDLLATDENVKLKIIEDANKLGQKSTSVQGTEETHIKSASQGLALLRKGTEQRKVASTKCNDLSSRSHTVFTITVMTKKTSETGEEHVSTGKLNLVDLAGSENIGRSGAENKRATEAGLINKSLLTLGRVINALVDRNSHIPYRESKLTRLLQDSLGGRTKTCIIATLSPAKHHLEETISTLDYAFRAKNIRNKPQSNPTQTKNVAIKDLASQIEQLKSDLIATRLRNGVHLSLERYDELTTESESRRILTEELRDKITTMEANLRNKTHELFTLTSNFNNLKADNEAVKQMLERTENELEKTEIILCHARENVEDETTLRKAHEDTEENLANIGGELISTLGQTTSDIDGLRSKLRRRSDLQSLNRKHWTGSQDEVSDATLEVQQKLTDFEEKHRQLASQLSTQITVFVQEEMAQLAESKSFHDEKIRTLAKCEQRIKEQTDESHTKMDSILDEIKTVKDDVKQQFGEGLKGLTAAAKRISEGIITELDTFHTDLHASYTSLGKTFKGTFDEIESARQSQRTHVEELWLQLGEATDELNRATNDASTRLDTVMAEEKEKNATERMNLIKQITSLINSQGQAQEKRIESRIESIQDDIQLSQNSFSKKEEASGKSIEEWCKSEDSFMEQIRSSRESVKNRIKDDWTVVNERQSSIQETTKSVHEETVKIVDAQMKQVDSQLQALDGILSHVKAQNSLHLDNQSASLDKLSKTVNQSKEGMASRLDSVTSQLSNFEQNSATSSTELGDNLEVLEDDIQDPLKKLRTNILSSRIPEYTPTGETPQKVNYEYPANLPRTKPHDVLLKNMRRKRVAASGNGENGVQPTPSPTKGQIFTQPAAARSDPVMSPSKQSARPESSNGSLREINVNIAQNSYGSPQKSSDTHMNTNGTSATDSRDVNTRTNRRKSSETLFENQTEQPPLKRQNIGPLSARMKQFHSTISSYPAQISHSVNETDDERSRAPNKDPNTTKSNIPTLNRSKTNATATGKDIGGGFQRLATGWKKSHKTRNSSGRGKSGDRKRKSGSTSKQKFGGRIWKR